MVNFSQDIPSLMRSDFLSIKAVSKPQKPSSAKLRLRSLSILSLKDFGWLVVTRLFTRFPIISVTEFPAIQGLTDLNNILTRLVARFWPESVQSEQNLSSKVTRLGNRFSLIWCHFLYAKNMLYFQFSHESDLLYITDSKLQYPDQQIYRAGYPLSCRKYVKIYGT